MNGTMTAAAASLVSCHDCDLLVRAHDDRRVRCPRCGARLRSRKAASLQRTWALVLTAMILYVPANLFPIMTVVSTGRAQSDTILSGVWSLALHGMWPLALLVFFASIVVPVLKLASLSYLLISVQVRSDWKPAPRTRLYRVTELIGRWSMVDIYVMTILVALVKLGALASVEAEPGAIFFGAVVVITMIAAETFDPRLIWDHNG